LPEHPQSGKVEPLWRHDLIKEFKAPMPGWGIASSPLIEGDLVIVQPGGANGSVAAFDRIDGRPVWHSLADPSGYSSPIAATIAGERQIVCCTGKAVVGVRAQDGGALWNYPWATAYDANIATPIVVGDYVFVSSGYGHGCALLHIQGDTKSMKAVPAYVKNNKLMRNHHNTCVQKGGFLYGIDSESGILRCIDLRTGKTMWESSARAKGCLILGGDRLVIFAEDGAVEVVKATPAAWQVTASLKDLLHQGESPCWVLPALDSGRLYLRDGSQIVCLDVKKRKRVAE
jgi:outer membrane protein assembly factor BamB